MIGALLENHQIDLEKLFPDIGEEEQKNESNHIFNATSVHISTASRLYLVRTPDITAFEALEACKGGCGYY